MTRLPEWRTLDAETFGLPHAAHAAFERTDAPVRMYLLWDHEAGWHLSVRLELANKPPVELGRVGLAGPGEDKPTVGTFAFAHADEICDRAVG